MQTEVQFLAYRKYTQKRQEASNALMALLAGAQMASHLLRLTEGSQHQLSQIFPSVEHISRFDLAPARARSLLDDAEAHLGAMSVPYVLAIHEEYLKTCLTLLLDAGRCTPRDLRAKAWELHGKVEDATGGKFNEYNLIIYDTLREMRNCLIHIGGEADSRLMDQVSRWTEAIASDWERTAHGDMREIAEGDKVKFSHGELIMSLAVTKRLAREANALLQNAIPRAVWADILISDMIELNRRNALGPKRMRKARRIADWHFAPLKLTDADLTAAFERVEAKNE